MNIYFVRHGETELNRRHIHQPPDAPLSEYGREQIEKTAKALKQFPVTKLISSDLLRAVESAEIIGDTLGLPPEQNAFFAEVRRPSVLYGKNHYTLETALVGFQMMFHLHNQSWHYSDEENLFDIKERVTKAVAFLAEAGKEHEHIAVVSHAFIINLFIKYMCAYKGVRIRDYLRTLLDAKFLGNASISTVAYNDDNNPPTCDWMCIDFNNREHLKI
jgi:probable phosphoglycerate mutase